MDKDTKPDDCFGARITHAVPHCIGTSALLESTMSRVRIISDGTDRGTMVLVDGIVVPNVCKVEWSILPDSLAVVKLELYHVEAELEGKIKRRLWKNKTSSKK